MGYKVEIYHSQYSAIDPNVAHDYEEFDNEDYLIVAPNSPLVYSSLMELYGTRIPVNMSMYITSDIQRDFAFSRFPCIKHKNKTHITFSDGEKTLTFEKSKLKKYVCYETKDMYVVPFKKLHIFSNMPMFFQLKEYLENVTRFAVEREQIYPVDSNMLDIIFRHNISAWALQGIFDDDENSLFIRFVWTDDDDDDSSLDMGEEREREMDFDEGLTM